jgi:RNA polymerase sigma factor (sigma-70 family)
MTTESAQFGVRAETNSDLDLVHASKNGDVTAFEQLVKRYDRKLLRIAQSVTHNREDSQDAVQEAFLKAYQHLAEFGADSQFSTWLIRITLNQSLMKLRKQRATRGIPGRGFPVRGKHVSNRGHRLGSQSRAALQRVATTKHPNQDHRRAATDFARGLRAARSRRPFNGTDGRSSEPESIRGKVKALAGSVAASRMPEQILRQVSRI